MRSLTTPVETNQPKAHDCDRPWARSGSAPPFGEHQRDRIRLLPEVYAHLNPMPYEVAAQMEKGLAADLRREGYTVTGGH